MQTAISGSLPTAFRPSATRSPLRISAAICVSLLSGLGSSSLQADVATGSSAGVPLTISATSSVALTVAVVPVTLTAGLNVTPLPAVSGNAPSSYVSSGSLIPSIAAGGSISVLGLVDLNTFSANAGLVQAAASSTVNGGGGNKATESSARVESLNVSFGQLNAPLLVTSVAALSITTGVIQSTANVQGAGAGLNFNGEATSSVANFDIRILGVSLFSISSLNPILATVQADLLAGNSVDVSVNLDGVVISVAGLSGIDLGGSINISNFNQETDGLLAGSASATALTIGLANITVEANVLNGVIPITIASLDTTINGTVTAAHSTAIQAVPEPSAALLLTGSLLGLLLIVRCRRPLAA